MPQIPTYDGPQVQARAVQPVMMSTPDVSSGAQALSRAIATGADALDKRLERDAETEANRIDTEVTAGWLKWDADNRRKYQGQNIGEYEVAAKEWWDKTKADYATTDPRVKQRIGEALGRKRNQAFASVLSHSANVREQYADQQSEAAAQTTVDFAVDTGNAAAGRDRVRQIVAEKAARKGWDTNMVEVENQRLLGTLHLAMITKMADTDAAKARAYYDANKGEIPAAAQGRVEQVLKGEADNQFATQFAAERAAKPLSEQLADAAKITDPERREKTVGQIRNNHALQESARRQSQQAAADSAWTQYVDKGRRVPEALRLAMGESNLRELMRWEQSKVDHDKTGGGPVKTDPETHRELWAMYGDDREKFAQVNLRQYGMKLSTQDFEQLVKLQSDIRTGKGQKDSVSFNNKVNAMIEQLGITGNAKQNVEKRGAFRRAAQVDFERMTAGGKVLTPVQEDELLDSLVKDITLKRRSWWADETGPAYTAPADVRDRELGRTAPATAQRPAAPVRVRTVEEARALPKGTRFIDPQGVERIR